MEVLHSLQGQFVNILILLFEFMGIIVIGIAGCRGIIDYVQKNPKIRLNLAKGMALGLEFKLGSEILRTVIIREMSEILLVGAIIVLRAALTFLIHWEIKVEEEATIKEIKETVETNETEEISSNAKQAQQ